MKQSKCVTDFKDKRENIYDERPSGRPSFIPEDLLSKVDENIRKDRQFLLAY